MIYGWAAIGALYLALLGALGFEHIRVVAANDRADAAETNLKAAQERATALALLWSAQVDKTESAARLIKEQSDARFADLEARVRALPRGHACVAGRDVERLLSDITAAANAPGSAGSGK